ncbi:MAG TPA: hypothetical protein PK646_01455 [Bacillota bacterium]|nr:hypothetical protein [Fastidiosipila sp.]HPX92863.1 hypothetical protein [Bacillota bacterium]HQB80747.1 hypothetical protein [Bacillota bacterium]
MSQPVFNNRKRQGGAGQMTDELGVRRAGLERRRRAVHLALALLVIATVSYAVWSILFVLTGRSEAVRLSFIRRGSIDLTASCPLIFLDNGTAVLSPAGGLLVPLLADGQRAAKGETLALIVAPDKEEVAGLFKNSMEKYRARLFVAGGFADPARFQSPRSPADSRLRNAIRALADLGGKPDLRPLGSSLERIRHEFNGAGLEAALFAGEDEELSQYALECEALLEHLKADPRTLILRAPEAGEVHFSMTELPPLDPIWEEMRLEMEAVPLRWVHTRNKQNDRRFMQVSQGEIIAGIRRFSGLKAAFYLDHETAEALSIKKGQRVDLSDPSGGLDLGGCMVERVEKTGPGQLYLLSCDGPACSSPRHAALAEVLLVVGRTSGLRVPVASLLDYDRETQSAGLRRIKGGMTETIEVKVTAADESHALILSKEGEERPLVEADLYVVNPWSIGDGQLID